MSKVFDFGKMDKDLSKIPGFELGSMLSVNDFSEVDDWISTGSLIMNAQVSGSLFGGVPNTRSFGLMGDPGCLRGTQEVRVFISEKTAITRTILIEGKLSQSDSLVSPYSDEMISAELGDSLVPGISLAHQLQEHALQNSRLIPIKEIFTSHYDRMIMAYTPDGFVPVNSLVIKKDRQIHHIATENGFSAEVSNDHLFETADGQWVSAQACSSDSILLTQSGPSPVTKNTIFALKEDVYDWEILHPNHRYWAGGISSHNTGKSFLCLNIVREAQKKGYNVIYCDTEGAIDKTSALKFGIDAHKIRYQPIQTVSQFQTFVSNVVEMVKKAKIASEDPKIMLVVDSLGMLSTDKELADAVKGHNAADMGSKAKELRKLFRVITLDLTAAKIPLIVTNHVYCLTAGHKVIMADGSLKLIEDILTGDEVQTLAGPRPVSAVYSFEEQDTIKLTLENGQTVECTPNHKFLVKNEWSDEENWKSANDLEEDDEIIFMNGL